MNHIIIINLLWSITVNNFTPLFSFSITTILQLQSLFLCPSLSSSLYKHHHHYCNQSFQWHRELHYQFNQLHSKVTYQHYTYQHYNNSHHVLLLLTYSLSFILVTHTVALTHSHITKQLISFTIFFKFTLIRSLFSSLHFVFQNISTLCTSFGNLYHHNPYVHSCIQKHIVHMYKLSLFTCIYSFSSSHSLIFLCHSDLMLFIFVFDQTHYHHNMDICPYLFFT